ncbi:MAG: prohibitin family protein [Leptospiraceae bacterium]|nr:prohibitin family protein [Leptospiraceae bacterium]
MRILKISLVLVINFVLSSCVSYIKKEEVGILSSPQNATVVSSGSVWVGWQEELIRYSTRWETHIEKVDVITQDDLHIDVVASIIMRPMSNKIVDVHLNIGKDYYPNIVKAEFRTAIRNIMTGYQMIMISKKSQTIEDEIKDLVSRKLANKYLEVSDVNIDDINLSPKILQAIEDKIARQQELETMHYDMKIAQRNEEIAKMKAKTESEVEIIRAEKEDQIAKIKVKTEAESDIIRATARAKAQKLVNHHLTPSYLKLKAIESHYKAFESPNSKIIVIPIGKDGLPAYINVNEKMFNNQGETTAKGKHPIPVQTEESE